MLTQVMTISCGIFFFDFESFLLLSDIGIYASFRIVEERNRARFPTINDFVMNSISLASFASDICPTIIIFSQSSHILFCGFAY